MGRAWVQFTAAFVLTFGIGAGLASGVFWLPRSEQVQATQPSPIPITIPNAPAASLVALLKEETELAPSMTWMPPAKGQKPDIVVHVKINFPGAGDRQTEFPFVWAEFDLFLRNVPGSYTAFGDGVGPDGEGIGSGESIDAACQPDGEIAIQAWAYWDLAGRVSGEGRGKVVIFPETMIENEAKELTFGDGLVVKWWLTK